LRFVCAFGGRGFFLLLVASVSVDVERDLIMVRVSGCAEAKSIGDWNEPELEDVGMEDYSCKVALVFMIN